MLYVANNLNIYFKMDKISNKLLRYVLQEELQKIKGIERTETFISLEESFSRNVKVI